MPRPADFTSRLFLGLGIVGLVSLGAITIVSPGATRMHAWPFSVAYGLALLMPGAILALRVWGAGTPLVLPRRSWTFLVVAAVVALMISGLASPYRGPSLLWSAPLLAGLAMFFLVFDWLHADPDISEVRRVSLFNAVGYFFALIAVVSIAMWAANLPRLAVGEIFEARNPFPLGHSNYTAGLALLMLPCFAFLAARAFGIRRLAWSIAGVLALGMLFTSGSRGGLVGLGALLVAGLFAAKLGPRKTFTIALALGIAALAFAIANPRTRSLFTRANPHGAPNVSNVQRSAMLDAGLAMGRARPFFGWGPGSTPLAFPRFRHQLNGGVEDVLQLHSLPLQLFAELGTVGLAGLLFFVALVLREFPRHRFAVGALLAYLVFALTDYQFDLPIFAFVLAALAASIAPPREIATSTRPQILDYCLRFVAVCLLGFGRADPTPDLNVRALALARDPGKEKDAIELLNTSIALNWDQEIAHFNLGWILVVRDPPAAEIQFLGAAHLVPDKGGVYFGLGLARLNQGQRDAAARAFAVECLNDPIFLVSPWWRDPVVGSTRQATFEIVKRALHDGVAPRAAVAYLSALIPWLENSQPASEKLAGRADTPERVAYFARHPTPPPFATAPVRFYHRERSGYPVLMRNLDLPVPVDLFGVQENSLAAADYRFLFPAKGWLENPALPAP